MKQVSTHFRLLQRLSYRGTTGSQDTRKFHPVSLLTAAAADSERCSNKMKFYSAGRSALSHNVGANVRWRLPHARHRDQDIFHLYRPTATSPELLPV